MTVHTFPIRVYYEDTDAGSVVYHASYVRFAERARTEMLRDNGYKHSELLASKGIAFAVRNMEVDFKRAAVLDDLLTVHTSITRLGGASFDMKQLIMRGDEHIAELKVVLVCMSVETLSPRRLPNEIREIFERQMNTNETIKPEHTKTIKDEVLHV